MTKPEILRQIDAAVARVVEYKEYVYDEYLKEWYRDEMYFDDYKLKRYTTDANAAEEAERFLTGKVTGRSDSCLSIEYYGGGDAWIVVATFPGTDEFSANYQPYIYKVEAEHPDKKIALSLAVLPEEERDYYIKLLEECGP